MTWRVMAALPTVAVAWILWAYSFESYENRRMPGSWTKVLVSESEAACEQKKNEQVTSLLNALAPFGASIDRAGNSIFYTTRSPDGRPVMRVIRYLCLLETIDPREESR